MEKTKGPQIARQDKWRKFGIITSFISRRLHHSNSFSFVKRTQMQAEFSGVLTKSEKLPSRRSRIKKFLHALDEITQGLGDENPFSLTNALKLNSIPMTTFAKVPEKPERLEWARKKFPYLGKNGNIEDLRDEDYEEYFEHFFGPSSEYTAKESTQGSATNSALIGIEQITEDEIKTIHGERTGQTAEEKVWDDKGIQEEHLLELQREYDQRKREKHRLEELEKEVKMRTLTKPERRDLISLRKKYREGKRKYRKG